MTRVPAAIRLLFTGACLHALLRAAEPASVPTVIESDSGEMISADTETTFSFRGNVTVTGTNLRLGCDQLVVVALRSGDPAALIGKQEKFKSLVATGHVRIVQNDREATCDHAEVFPQQEQIILTGHLVVRALDNSFVQTGEKGTLYRDQRRAVIEGSATERPRITLPSLKDLGYGKEPEKTPANPQSAPPTVTVPPPQPK
jgi:lipopolysaccharide export system protein LptA